MDEATELVTREQSSGRSTPLSLRLPSEFIARVVEDHFDVMAAEVGEWFDDELLAKSPLSFPPREAYRLIDRPRLTYRQAVARPPAGSSTTS